MKTKLLIFITILSILLVLLLYSYFTLPSKLKHIEKADDTALVKFEKEIHLTDMKNPINASIIEYQDDFLIAFRFKLYEYSHEKNFIGIAVLDKDFNEKQKYIKIETQTQTAEDPRIFSYNDDYYLIFNDLITAKHKTRAIHIAHLNKNLEIDYKTPLDLHIKPVEKNWVPFINEDKLLLAYSLMPHKILHLKNTKTNSLEQYLYPNNLSYKRFYWDWGTPRGGTPAKLIDGEYLAFFQSCFGKKNKQYVMGAYTFEPKEPYRITKVSKYPILFGDLRKKRVIYPTGFVVKDNTIYVSFGENDSISKIVAIDKAKLFSSLKTLD